MSLDIDLYNDPCPTCGVGGHVFDANITHNLNAMADEAGIYELVWRPEETDVKVAGDLIEPLTKAIVEMKADPERFKKHEPENKWGTYDDFVPWLERYLEACKQYPRARIEACR